MTKTKADLRGEHEALGVGGSFLPEQAWRYRRTWRWGWGVSGRSSWKCSRSGWPCNGRWARHTDGFQRTRPGILPRCGLTSGLLWTFFTRDGFFKPSEANSIIFSLKKSEGKKTFVRYHTLKSSLSKLDRARYWTDLHNPGWDLRSFFFRAQPIAFGTEIQNVGLR